MPIEIEEFRKLAMEERILIVEQLWDDIASCGEAVPVHSGDMEEAVRRADELDRTPEIGLTREEMWRQVDESHD